MAGIFLGVHKNEPNPKYFVVLGFNREIDWPPINVEKVLAEHIKTGGYKAVWYQDTEVPEPEMEQS